MCIKKRNKSNFMNCLDRQQTPQRASGWLSTSICLEHWNFWHLSHCCHLKNKAASVCCLFMSVAEVLFLPLFFKIGPALDCWLFHSPCRLPEDRSIWPLCKHAYVFYTQGHTGPWPKLPWQPVIPLFLSIDKILNSY